MSIIVDEIGALAAQNVGTLLAAYPDHPWSHLVEGGWAGLGADEDADLQLRDVQEVARVAGRHSTATPLVTTLLAGRWFRPGDDVLAAGASVVVPCKGGGLLSAYATEGAVLLDASGAQVDAEGEVDDFAEALPVRLLDEGTAEPLGPEHQAELAATLAAVVVGCADTVLDTSVEWSQTRHQFGQPIASFQAVRHHLANMHIAREQAWTAAIAAGSEQQKAAQGALLACDLAIDCIELGIQVHGGVGFTKEVGLHIPLNHVWQARTLVDGLA